MENKKGYYDNLINKWRESKNKIPIAQRIAPGGKIEAIITIEYIEEREKIKKEIDGCLNFLTEEQLEELFTDDYFMGRAMQILFDRKKLEK